jgi:hypothetical protein
MQSTGIPMIAILGGVVLVAAVVALIIFWKSDR